MIKIHLENSIGDSIEDNKDLNLKTTQSDEKGPRCRTINIAPLKCPLKPSHCITVHIAVPIRMRSRTNDTRDDTTDISSSNRKPKMSPTNESNTEQVTHWIPLIPSGAIPEALKTLLFRLPRILSHEILCNQCEVTLENISLPNWKRDFTPLVNEYISKRINPKEQDCGRQDSFPWVWNFIDSCRNGNVNHNDLKLRLTIVSGPSMNFRKPNDVVILPPSKASLLLVSPILTTFVLANAEESLILENKRRGIREAVVEERILVKAKNVELEKLQNNNIPLNDDMIGHGDRDVQTPKPNQKDKTMSSIRGLDDILEQICDALLLPIFSSGPSMNSMFSSLFSTGSLGVLLYGPPGVGKTLAACLVPKYASTQWSRIVSSSSSRETSTTSQGVTMSSHEEVSMPSQETTTVSSPESSFFYRLFPINDPSQTTAVFTQAHEFTKTSPFNVAIVFIDEIDRFCAQRSEIGRSHATGSNQRARKLTAELLYWLDGERSDGNMNVDMNEEKKRYEMNRVTVLACTNHVNRVDYALRRPGRLGTEIKILPPNIDQRKLILAGTLHGSGIIPSKESVVDIDFIAKNCVGYVGADLAML
eukprot:g1669.t1